MAYKTNVIPTGMTRGDDQVCIISCPEKPFVDGDTVTMTVRTTSGGGNIILQKQTGSFIDGEAYIQIAHDDTKDLKFGIYSYDVEVLYMDIGHQTIIDPSPFTLGKEDTY